MFFKREETPSRAERVRRRRQAGKAPASQRTRRLKTKARPPRAQAAVATASVPMVVSRYGVVGGAAVSAGHVRRQVRVTRGRYTEIVAALPTISLGWRTFSLTLSLLVIVILAALWYAPAFRVDVPEVHGTHYLEAERLAARLGVNGRPVVALSPADLAQRVETLPAVAHAKVSVSFPNRVVLAVQERQPMLVWQSGGKTWWVDAEGVAFLPVTDEAPKTALTVQADAFPEGVLETRPGEMHMLSAQQVQALQTLAHYLPAGTPLVYSRRYGLGWRAQEGWQVFVGRSLTQMDKRMKLYEALAAWLQTHGLKPAVVNVASLRAPYYRMEP